MGKVHKVSADLYQFVKEDSSCEMIKGVAAIERIKQLDKPVSSKENNEREHAHCMSLLSDIEQFLNSKEYKDNVDAFNYHLDSQRCELSVDTGKLAFDEKAYNNAMQERKIGLESVQTQLRALNDTVSRQGWSDVAQKEYFALHDKKKKLLDTVIVKSDYNMPVFETIAMNGNDALELVNEIIKREHELNADARQKAINAEIEKDKHLVKDLSDDDFAFMRMAKRLYNPKAFYDCFGDKYNLALSFETKQDFIARQHDVKYDQPKTQFSESDKHTLAWFHDRMIKIRNIIQQNKLLSDIEGCLNVDKK